MTCPTCHSAMLAEPAFFSATYVCPSCTRGERPTATRGYVILDMGLAHNLQAQALTLMVFQDARDAVSSLSRMRNGPVVYEVTFDKEPVWHPRKLRPEDQVAWCEVRWDEKFGGLVGRQEKG